MTSKRINLFLVGRTGNGKSATGNSILGKTVFRPKSSTYSDNHEIKAGTSDIDGTTVTVVDGSGIGETDSEFPTNADEMIGLAEKALGLLPNGSTAMIFVIKYGTRFTKQEKDAVQVIKSIFGPDIFRNHGIILMTNGDNFEMDMEDDGKTFDQWCQEQTGDIQYLFQECNRRYVLFKNKSKDPKVQKEQFKNLLTKVQLILDWVGPYGKDDFAKAISGRNKLQVMSGLPFWEEKVDKTLAKIDEELNLLAKFRKRGLQSSISEYDNLQKRLRELKKEVGNFDRGTNSTDALNTRISLRESSIKTKIRHHEQGYVALNHVDDSGRPNPGFWGRIFSYIKRRRVAILAGLVFFSVSALYMYIIYKASHNAQNKASEFL